MAAARDSVGYEIDGDFTSLFDDRVENIERMSRDVNRGRLSRHKKWVDNRILDGESPQYETENYETLVTTQQEQDIVLYAVDDVQETDEGYAVTHTQI
jgi:hypothetical protein